MNQRLISVLAFAFIVSAGASLLLYRLLSNRAPATPATKAAKLILSTHTLEAGTLIRDADLRTGEWTGILPEGVIQKREDIVGRGVVSPIFNGEPVVESRLAPKGGGAGLAALIPKGMRAAAIRVNEIVGVAGFAVPGMRVDVLVAGNPPGATSSGSVARTLLQNVQVLSAGQNFQKDVEGKPISVTVVNLLVTPEQAEMLSLASNGSNIQLVLRNPLDAEILKTNGSAMAQLFRTGPGISNGMPPVPRETKPGGAVHASPPVPAAPPLPKPRVVEVIHGVRRVDAQFAPQAEDRP